MKNWSIILNLISSVVLLLASIVFLVAVIIK